MNLNLVKSLSFVGVLLAGAWALSVTASVAGQVKTRGAAWAPRLAKANAIHEIRCMRKTSCCLVVVSIAGGRLRAAGRRPRSARPQPVFEWMRRILGRP